MEKISLFEISLNPKNIAKVITGERKHLDVMVEIDGPQSDEITELAAELSTKLTSAFMDRLKKDLKECHKEFGCKAKEVDPEGMSLKEFIEKIKAGQELD